MARVSSSVVGVVCTVSVISIEGSANTPGRRDVFSVGRDCYRGSRQKLLRTQDVVNGL